MDRAGSLDGVVMRHWVVYESPRDYPGQYIAREWLIRRGELEPVWTRNIRLAPTLDAVREMLPSGLVCTQRRDGDDPTIVEVWL